MTGHTSLPRLMLVARQGSVRGRTLVGAIAEAVDGGVGLVLVREPTLDQGELVALVQRLRTTLRRAVGIVVEAPAEVAEAAHAGLHVRAGAEAPAALGDGVLGRHALYGMSIGDAGDAERAAVDGASYALLEPAAETCGAPPGAERVREVAFRLRGVPLYVEGDFSPTGVPELIHAGAHGVAVGEALLSLPKPRRVAQSLELALDVAAAATQRHVPSRLF